MKQVLVSVYRDQSDQFWIKYLALMVSTALGSFVLGRLWALSHVLGHLR